LRYYHAYRGRSSDQHGYAQLTRFISEKIMGHFECPAAINDTNEAEDQILSETVGRSVRQRVRAMWS
jgi:hypothetical protein